MEVNPKGYPCPELLTNTEWLQEHVYDPTIRIIDCDPYESYRRAHIPNSVGIKVHHYIKDINDTVHVMPHEPFVALMSDLGISSDSQVITYDSFGGLYASRLWWVLNFYGHRDVKVLDGGWNKWFSEGRPISILPPTIARGVFQINVNTDLLCTLTYAKDCVQSGKAIMLDLRSDDEWTGTNTRGNQRSGHIPKAKHLEWLRFVDDTSHKEFKPAIEIEAMLRELGIDKDKEIITY